MAEINPGAFFEIRVAGKVRSYRDRREVALEAGNYLKQRNPSSKVEVRDHAIRNRDRHRTKIVFAVPCFKKAAIVEAWLFLPIQLSKCTYPP